MARSRRVAIMGILVASFLVGPSSFAGAKAAKQVPASKYARVYCAGLVRLQATNAQYTQGVGQAGISAAQAQAILLPGLAKAVEQSGRWQRDLAGVVPNVKNGAALAKLLVTATGTLHRAFVQAKATAAGLSTADEAAYGRAIHQLGLTLFAREDDFAAAVKAPINRNTAFRKAAVAIPSCAHVVTAPTSALAKRADDAIRNADPQGLLTAALPCINQQVDGLAPLWTDTLGRAFSGATPDLRAATVFGELVRQAAAQCGVHVTIQIHPDKIVFGPA